ncbi:hypothetical protein ACJW31_06G103300 [Castanea mollissima]
MGGVSAKRGTSLALLVMSIIILLKTSSSSAAATTTATALYINNTAGRLIADDLDSEFSMHSDARRMLAQTDVSKAATKPFCSRQPYSLCTPKPNSQNRHPEHCDAFYSPRDCPPSP